MTLLTPHLANRRRIIFSLLLAVAGWSFAAETEGTKALLGEANRAFDTKDFEQARRLALQAAEDDESKPAALWLLGRVSLETGAPEQAYRTLNHAQLYFRDSPDGPAVKALFQTAARGWIAEIDRQISVQDPALSPDERADAFRAKARVWVDLEDWNQAVAAFTQAIGKSNDDHSLCERAEVYASLGRRDLALADYRRFIRHGSGINSAASDFIRLVQKEGNDDEVIAESTFALRYGTSGREERAQAYERRSQIARAIADYRRLHADDTRREFFIQRLNELELTPGLNLVAEAAVILAEAERAEASGDAPAACERSEAALALNPRLLAARIRLGRNLHRIPRRDDEALETLLQARDQADEAERPAALAELHRVAGDMIRKQEKDLEEQKPDSAEAWNRPLRALIVLQVQAGEYESALKTCARFATLVDPIPAHRLAGEIHELRRDFDQAIREYQACIAGRAPWREDETDDWGSLRKLRLAREDYKGLIADLTLVLEASPKETIARAWRADAFERAGDLRAALQDVNVLVDQNFLNYKPVALRYPLLQKLGDYEAMKNDCRSLISSTTPATAAAASALAFEGARRNDLKELIDQIYPAEARESTAGKLLFCAVASVLQNDPSASLALKRARPFVKDEPALEYAYALWCARSVYSWSDLVPYLLRARQLSGSDPDESWVQLIVKALETTGSDLPDALRRTLVFETLALSFPRNSSVQQGQQNAQVAYQKLLAQASPEQIKHAEYIAANDLQDAAVKLENESKIDEALRGYARALRVKVDHIQSASRTAVILLARGQSDFARGLLRDVAAARLQERGSSTASKIAALDRALDEQLVGRSYTRTEAIKCVTEVFCAIGDDLLYQELLFVIAGFRRELPDDVDLLVLLAEIRLKDRSVVERVAFSIEDMKKAIALRPDDPALHATLADLLEQQMSGAEAVDQWRAALALDSTNEKYCLNLAKRLFRLDRNQEGTQELLRFWRHHGSVPAMRTLAKWYYDHDQKDTAYACVVKIVELDPQASTDPFPPVNFELLGYLNAKLRATFEQIKLDDAARASAAREAKRQAEVQARQAARQAEIEALRQARLSQKKRDWVTEFGDALHNLPTMGDNGFQKMADQNAAVGARLQQNIDSNKRLDAHLHEIERKFTGR